MPEVRQGACRPIASDRTSAVLTCERGAETLQGGHGREELALELLRPPHRQALRGAGAGHGHPAQREDNVVGGQTSRAAGWQGRFPMQLSKLSSQQTHREGAATGAARIARVASIVPPPAGLCGARSECKVRACPFGALLRPVKGLDKLPRKFAALQGGNAHCLAGAIVCCGCCAGLATSRRFVPCSACDHDCGAHSQPIRRPGQAHASRGPAALQGGSCLACRMHIATGKWRSVHAVSPLKVWPLR